MSLSDTNDVFDHTHFAATPWQKLKRSAELGPKYFGFDLPRYFVHRLGLRLPVWDLGVFLNPLRELSGNTYEQFELPPRYGEALLQLRDAGVRITMPRRRLEALVGAWWATRGVPGDLIECGAFRGATSLLLSLLGHLHHVDQKTLVLDTFAGMPEPTRFDAGREGGEFRPSDDQVALIRRRARLLGVRGRVEVHRGLFSDTFRQLEQGIRFAFVHIDANIFEGTKDACEFTLPRLWPGGIVVFDDYNGVCDLGARLAIHSALAGNPRPRPLSGTSAYLQMKT